MAPTHLETLIIEAPQEDHDRIEMAMQALPTTGYACWTPIDSKQDRHEAYFDNTDDADRAYNALHMQKLASSNPDTWTMSRAPLLETDWANAWKKHFKVEKVSNRIVIQPEWESYTPQEQEIVIRIDPGMSFGTGRHETTRSCLRLLDTWTQQGNKGSFLDLGCGSGILSIAAAQLGLCPVQAMDIDPDAVQGAIENIERNAPPVDIDPFRGDVSSLQLEHPYDMVVANILAPILCENVAPIAATVKSGGFLILSGILTSQYKDVRDTYAKYDFQEQQIEVDGEWSTGLFCKETI